jgi:glycosyltransferase involved in cell wall biosynthesis
MRVLIVSRWRFNPYQKLLVSALRRRGADVVERELDAALTAVAEEKPDVLHLQNVHDRLHTPLAVMRFMRAVREAKRAGVRIVWTVHDLRDHSRRNALLGSGITRFLTKTADAAIVHCDDVLPAASNVFTIPHGHYIDYYENRVNRGEARRALGIDDREFVFLFLGWIRRYKGVMDLVDAFGTLDGARLLIAGSAPERRLLHSLQRRAGTNVTIVPEAVDDEHIQLYMNACDTVVLPYRRSLTSGAAVLAMSFARACIAPRIGCFGQMLDERGAFLYPRGGLHEAMQSAIRRRDELPAMGRHNQARAATWDWDRIAARTLEVYGSGSGSS